MTIAADMLALYTQAEKNVLEGRSASINGMTLTMENLSEIRIGRAEWETRVAAESPAGKATSTIGGRRFSVARLD